MGMSTFSSWVISTPNTAEMKMARARASYFKSSLESGSCELLCRRMVWMAILVCHFDAVSLTEIIHLGEKVTESLFRFSSLLRGGIEDECIVHHLVACLRLQFGASKVLYPKESFAVLILF